MQLLSVIDQMKQRSGSESFRWPHYLSLFSGFHSVAHLKHVLSAGSWGWSFFMLSSFFLEPGAAESAV